MVGFRFVVFSIRKVSKKSNPTTKSPLMFTIDEHKTTNFQKRIYFGQASRTSPPHKLQWSVVKRSLPQVQPVNIDHVKVIRPVNDMLVKKWFLHLTPDAHKSGRTDNDAHETVDTRTHSVTSTATTPHGVNETNT
jgi:hypothetical protein